MIFHPVCVFLLQRKLENFHFEIWRDISSSEAAKSTKLNSFASRSIKWKINYTLHINITYEILFNQL